MWPYGLRKTGVKKHPVFEKN
uniref:Uncharacterized protein n=1 Tax=Anguilla anguilla TaxID=7936 RepID=A0A0E9VXJ0_ANGAN